MNLSSKQAVKQILAKYQIKPSRGLGQNFLVDSRAIHRLISAAQVGKEDTVLAGVARELEVGIFLFT